MTTGHVDVIVVGAGISGISMAYHLATRCPDRRYLILEARQAMGGTWDLFRYPGIRSDSDMHTLGFGFRPWTGDRAIAGGDTIRAYIEETAVAHGIDRHIRFGTAVTAASWSTEAATWTVEATGPDGPVRYRCDFLSLCVGYYDYARGYAPVFPGQEDFRGTIVHPQDWPATLDWRDRRVVVIGSGATAVTLVPALAAEAASVTMLQRSPGYIAAVPARDRIAHALRRILPARAAYRVTRWKNVAIGLAFFRSSRRWPRLVARLLIRRARRALPAGFDIATHLTPRYDPWDQRVCLIPDGDLFRAIAGGRAAIVTDTIDRFVADGIRVSSGATLPADIVVTATGLRVKLAGGIALAIDGEPLTLARRLQYKGMMFDRVPNLALTFGYTNASWTLKADLTAIHVCRLLNTMRRRGMRQVMPVNDDAAMVTSPAVDFTSTYIARVAEKLPRQGAKAPWRVNQNYLLDTVALRYGRVDRGMVFSNPRPAGYRPGPDPSGEE